MVIFELGSPAATPVGPREWPWISSDHWKSPNHAIFSPQVAPDFLESWPQHINISTGNKGVRFPILSDRLRVAHDV